MGCRFYPWPREAPANDWVSSIFRQLGSWGSFGGKQNSQNDDEKKVVPLYEDEAFQGDWLGLKTLSTQKRLV